MTGRKESQEKLTEFQQQVANPADHHPGQRPTERRPPHEGQLLGLAAAFSPSFLASWAAAGARLRPLRG